MFSELLFIVHFYNLISLWNSWKLCIRLPGEQSSPFLQWGVRSESVGWGETWQKNFYSLEKLPCCLERGKVSASRNGPFSYVSASSEGKQNTFPTSDFMTSARTTSERLFKSHAEGAMFYKVCKLWKENIWFVSWVEFTHTNYWNEWKILWFVVEIMFSQGRSLTALRTLSSIWKLVPINSWNLREQTQFQSVCVSALLIFMFPYNLSVSRHVLFSKLE